jgi:hypothetical protein
VKANFFKIVAFKGTIRKFVNMVAAHIEGSWHPAYLKHYFHVSVPLKGNFFLETCFFLIIPILNITGEMKIMANRNCSIF